MEYSKLLDLTTELGYQLAMCGAETFRVEESVVRVLKAYEIEAEVFAIPNCLHISIEPEIGRPLTRMRRIGHHGNDLDSVERFTNVSRRICAEKPTPEVAEGWLQEAISGKKSYKLPIYLSGNFLGAFGFAFMFGGNPLDALCAGLCGALIGLINRFLDRLETNPFFRILIAAFVMALPAYGLNALGIVPNSDAAVIGALMILVPGLLFTNAMRDIIYGDTNSGINRIVQVLLIAMAIALGTGSALNVSRNLWGSFVSAPAIDYGYLLNAVAAFAGCMGFVVLFNIHGPGSLLCALGGMLTWLIYLLCIRQTGNSMAAYFWSALFASFYAEGMARIRRYPAISYLVVSIFPLIPGAGVYYTMSHALQGNTDAFADKGMETAAVAGIMAVAILLGSTSARIAHMLRNRYRHRKAGVK